MRNKAGSATRKAILHVCESIEGNRLGTQLPSIKQLSKDADVSLQTMWKAVQILKEKGLIESSYAKRLLLRPHARENANAVASMFAESDRGVVPRNLMVWEQVAADIKQAVLTGVYTPDVPLPSLKELRNIYHVSFVTLKKALESLRAEGMLCRYAKTYAVVPVGTAHKLSRIVFSTISLKYRRLTLGTFTEEFVRSLENECASARVKLEHVLLLRENENLVLINNRQEECSFPDDDSILGYVILVCYSPDEGYQRIFRAVSHCRKPVAVLDIVGGWRLPQYLQRKNVRLFSAATSGQCGSLVARYLLQAGHAKAAYISPYHQAQWSKERFRAVNETFETAGLTNAVGLFCYENPPVIDSFYQNIVNENVCYEKLLDSYRQWRTGAPAYYRGMLDTWFERTLPENILSRIEFDHTTRALLDRVMKESGATAWIAANDRVALIALSYLKEKGARVPEDISVIGFDDTLGALNNSLTSFSFNMREAMHLIFNFIVNTRSFDHRSGARAIEVGGKIIERATVKTR
ncbi:MAG: GntR family transcriptional regulator [Chitinivibrionales bacterium]|nr:GntR family transcriptional regulator [Chitinivibrionales bacterium]